jgi:hypothetical protein
MCCSPAPGPPIQLIAACALVSATASCSEASAPDRPTAHASVMAPSSAASTDRVGRADPCRAEVRGDRLVARPAYGGDVFLPPNGISPRTSPAAARATMLADPSASCPLGHRHQQEIFAIYQNFKGRRPVWLLLEHHVPSSGSLSNKIANHDLVDILNDHTRRPVSILDALPDSCRPTSAH